jgi:hypothetical protein
MPSSLLFMSLKIPPRNDLVQPLANWLDGSEQVGFQNVTNPLQWVVPKPDFSSIECRSELLRLAALRNCLSENLQDSHKAALQAKALEDCQEYHATLLEFEKIGFPTVEDELNGIALTWKGAYGVRQQETHYSLVWDRACTLWNVAALQSSLAADADCSTKEGCKIAISQSQTAASNLAILRQLIESDDYSSVDVSQAMLSFWEKLLLAQGQLSIYKIANLGDSVRQHTTLAYLIQAAAAMYNEALTWAQDPRLQSEVPKQSKEWGAHCKAKSLLCQSRAIFHLSIEHRQKKQHGPEIARLRQCVEQLKECHGFCKSADLLLPEVQGLVHLAQDRLTHAEHDNRTIYMDDVPRELAEIRAQTMVKTDLPLAPAMMVTKVALFTFSKT